MGIREDEKIAPHCEFIHVHDKVVKRVMDVMPEGEELQNLAEFFRVFGDSTRIRILYALSQSELCVCDIASLLGMGQSAIRWTCTIWMDPGVPCAEMGSAVSENTPMTTESWIRRRSTWRLHPESSICL